MAKLTGNEDHEFPLSTASQWTANYRNSVTPGTTIAHCFGKGYIEQIFAQEGCVGMRIYYALDGNGQKQLIIVGVDENGNDLYNGLIAERSQMCPTYCSAANLLNSNT